MFSATLATGDFETRVIRAWFDDTLPPVPETVGEEQTVVRFFPHMQPAPDPRRASWERWTAGSSVQPSEAIPDSCRCDDCRYVSAMLDDCDGGWYV